MSLLTVVQDAVAEIGLREPRAAAAAAQTSGARNLAALARREARTLADRHEWDALCARWQFTAVNASVQPGGLPDDFGRLCQETEIWGPSGPLKGPYDKSEWQRLTLWPSTLSSGCGAWRIFGNQLELSPNPAAGGLYRFDYVRKEIFTDANGNPKPTWAADTDICLIDEDLITLGIIWRFLKGRGLDYGEAMVDAENAFAARSGRDGGGRKSIAVGRATYPGSVGVAYPFKLGPDQ